MKRGIFKGANLYISTVLVLTVLFSCNKNPKFEKTKSGLKYMQFSHNSGPKPEVKDIMYIKAKYRTDYDSVLYNSSKIADSIMVELTEPTFVGGFEEGFRLLSVGDSATFYLPADSVFKHTFKMALPPYIKSGSGIYLDVKLVAIEKRADFDERQRIAEEEMVLKEKSMLAAYAAQKNMKVEPNPSGLYFVKKSSGNGPKAEPGDKVTMAYTGMLLDGTVFDASDRHPGDFEFTLGVGQVIRGWDEAVSLMRKGDKAYILIPSYMAYGPRGSGQLIPPNSPLAFDIEVLDVKKP